MLQYHWSDALLDCCGPGKKELIRCGVLYTMVMWRCWCGDVSSAIICVVARVNFPPQSLHVSTPQAPKSVVRHPRPMPRNIIHSDVSVDPESESEALSIAPDAEEEPEVEPEEEEEEGEGDVDVDVDVDVEEEDEGGDEREEGDDGDEGEEEGEEVDEPEEEEEDEEPADDGDGDAVREVRTAAVHHL